MVEVSRWTGRAALLAAIALNPVVVDAQVAPLALELDGTRVPLGSAVHLVLRTTETRALKSAEFSFEVRDRDGIPAVAFVALESYTLLSAGEDATIDVDFDVVTQRATVAISDPDGLVNHLFGPLAVFRFDLDPGVETGDRFEIWLDPDTKLVDTAAESVTTAVGRGDVRIVDDEPGQGLGALGGEVFPGFPVVLGAVTERPFAIGAGTVELFYDATLFEAGYEVRIDVRYGVAAIDTVENPAPGHLVVSFTSAFDDVNLEVHGAFLTVELVALDSVPVGTLSTVLLGPATELFDPSGKSIALEVDGEELEFIDPGLVARAAFEGGNFAEWWTVVQ